MGDSSVLGSDQETDRDLGRARYRGQFVESGIILRCQVVKSVLLVQAFDHDPVRDVACRDHEREG